MISTKSGRSDGIASSCPCVDSATADGTAAGRTRDVCEDDPFDGFWLASSVEDRESGAADFGATRTAPGDGGVTVSSLDSEGLEPAAPAPSGGSGGAF